MLRCRLSLKFCCFRKNREANAVFSFPDGNYLLFERIATIRSPKAILKESVSNTVMGITSLAELSTNKSCILLV